MFEPFIWMFKTKNFKEHFLYLFFTFFKFGIPAAISCALALFVFNDNFLISIVLYAISGLLILAPMFCVQGYFWEMTEAIISRDWDIKAASIYNGKVSSIYSVELPPINTLKFIWRGIASIVATVLLVLPFITLLSSVLFTGTFNLPMQNIGAFENTYCIAYTALLFFLLSFIPALLWNYAYRNSVVAVWNIRKAIYIMGNYTGKYIWHTILFFVVNFSTSFVFALLASVLGVQQVLGGFTPLVIVNSVIYFFLTYFVSIYLLYVYAYLLGTITPPAEK